MSLYATIGRPSLKVIHYGSDTSASLLFLVVVNPRVRVISVGKNNRFGHPTPGVTERLKEKLGSVNIYRIDKYGNMGFTTDGERLWVEVEK